MDPAIEGWLMELVAGRGRDGSLTGHQRHFLRVLDGMSLAVREEKQWLQFVRDQQRRNQAGEAPPQPAEPTVNENPSQGRTIRRPEGPPSAVLNASDAGYAERLATRRTYQRAQSNQTCIDGRSDPTPSAPHQGTAGVSESVPSQSHAMTEDEQIRYVLWTVLAWRRFQPARPEFGASWKKAWRAASESLSDVSSGAAQIGQDVGETVRAGGAIVRGAAEVVAEGADQVRAKVQRRANSTDLATAVGTLEKAAIAAAAGGAAAVSMGSAAVGKVAAAVSTRADIVGGVVEGTIRGVTGVVQGVADHMGYTEDDIAGLRHEVEIAQQTCAQIRGEVMASMPLPRTKSTSAWLECVTLAGLAISDIVAKQAIPADLQDAYAAAFPVESQSIDLADKMASMHSDEQVSGFLNALKGKLFELKYLEELNAELTGQGLHASLADSATQPGWDIEVTDHSGHVVELLSLKATEHVDYVRHALERYPDIDVVSTSEVYAALAGTPDGAHVLDGGIDNIDLADHVDQAVQQEAVAHAGLSLLAILPALYKHVIASDKSSATRAAALSEHLGRVKVAGLAGSATLLVAPYWPAALLAAMGVSQLARIGGNRREQYERLLNLRDSIHAESKRLAVLLAPG